MKKQLALYRQISQDNPSAIIAIGGSIGLALQKIQIRDKFDNSDLDMTSDEALDLSSFEEFKSHGGDSADMHYNILHKGTKAQIQVDYSHECFTVVLDGYHYRVSTLKHILGHKIRYANQGYQKHIDDVKTITEHLGLS